MAGASSGNSELETLSNAAAMVQRESEDVASQQIEETNPEETTLIEECIDTEEPGTEEPRPYVHVEEAEEDLNFSEERESYEPAASEEPSQVEVQDEGCYDATVLQDESSVIDVGTEERSGEACVTEVRNDQEISIVGLQVDKEDDAIVVMTSDIDEFRDKEPDVLAELRDMPSREEHKGSEPISTEQRTDEEQKISELQVLGTQASAEGQQDKSSEVECPAITDTAEIITASVTETPDSPTATKRSHIEEPEISDSAGVSEAKRKRDMEPEHNYSLHVSVSGKNGQASVPVTGGEVVPVTDQEAIPVTGQVAVPLTGQESVPVTGQTAVPVTGQEAIPVTGQEAVTVTNQQAVPVQPLTGAPEEEKTTEMEGSQIHVPLADHSQDPTQLFIPVSQQVQMNTVDLKVTTQNKKEDALAQDVRTLENSFNVVQHVSPTDKPVPVQKVSLSEHLFTIEVTTLTTVGGVSKPMTVTVLNVASVKFKCSHCSEPFKNQMIGAQLKFYKTHSCKKLSAAKSATNKAPPTSQPLRQGASPLTSPVTRSVAKALIGASPRTPQVTPTPVAAPHATRSAVKRGNQSSTSQNIAKVSTPRQTKAKQVAKTSPSVKVEKEKKAETGEGKDAGDKDDDDDVLHSVHTLATRDGQLQFIKEQYNKVKRWNLRKRKRRVVKDEASSENEDDKESKVVESNEVKEEAEEVKDGGDNMNDPDDANDGDEKSFDGDESKDDVQDDDDDNADEGSDNGVEDETGEKLGGRKKEDFCIQCYLKLDHKCKIKLMTENRVTSKTCQFCGKTYKTVNSLNQHMRLHTGERPYECKECGKTFRRSSTLFEHMRIHGGEKRYLCSMCGRKFLRKSDHTAHLRRHNNDFKYRCSECGKGFKGNAQLEVHMRKHTGEMPFLCTVCGRKFKHPFGLRVHMKYHEMVENPLKCTECDTVYDDPDELRMHECVAGKQHMCSVCGKTFANPFAIKGHMKIHTRPNPSVCKSCHVTFPNEQELQKHQDENIVKCSVCTKTIKEARSCMLKTLPGNPLKGKKFKCWKCHSAQTGAKAVQTPVVQPQNRGAQQVSHSTQQTQTPTETVMKTVVTSPQQQVQPQQVILTTPQRSQQVKPQMILQSPIAASLPMQSPPKVDSSPKLSQPLPTFHSGQQVVAIQYSPPMHQAQNVQQLLPPMHQTIHVASGSRHLTQQTQLSQAIQSIQPQERDQTAIMYQHQPSQTMYSTMTQQTRSADTTVHYPTQQIHQMQTYQHHQPQQVQQQQQQHQPQQVQQQHQQHQQLQQQQQQHAAQVQTIYQVQHVQQESLLSPQQNVHQM